MLPRRRWALLGALLVTALVVAACGQATPVPPPSASGSTSEQVPATDTTVTVLTLNVEYGGRLVSFDRVIEAIRLSGADVVGINEAQGSTADIAAALGWQYYDLRHAVVSRLPIVRTAPESRHLLVQTGAGGVFALANIHLSSDPYGPDLVLAGRRRAAVLANENDLRMPELAPVIASFAGLDPAIPRVLIGDLNSPSHQDWTTATVGRAPQIRYPVAWPVTIALEEAGYVDAYRARYPDPVQHPGLTWPAARPKLAEGWNPPADAPADRIDYVFTAGPVEAGAVGIVGEPAAQPDHAVSPWPTDHRGVYAELRLTGLPVPAPPTIAPADLRARVGADLVVQVVGAVDGARVRVVDARGGSIADLPLTETPEATVRIPTDGWEAREHRLELVGADGAVLADAQVWLMLPGTGPTLTMASARIPVGEPVSVSWYGAPGSRWDWVGVYPRGADAAVAEYLGWAYTGATVAGTVELGGAGSEPLAPGRYSVYLLVDDGYEVIARADFTVG